MYIKAHSSCNDIPLIRCIEKIFLAIIEAWDLAPIAPVGRHRVNILYIFRGLLFMLIRVQHIGICQNGQRQGFSKVSGKHY
jgi:hypothetical protein